MSSKKITQAMVFCAGLGKRMRPLTDTLPKPLIPVKGKPMLSYTLEKLQAYGVKHMVLNTHYLAEKLEEFVAQHPKLPIDTIHEDTLLDTGGGLVNALPLLGKDPFFVINGDIIWQDGPVPALKRLMQHWDDSLDALLLLHPVKQAVGYDGAGDFDLTAEQELIRYVEKGARYPYVFTGVQILHPRVLKGRSAVPFSLGQIYREASIQGNTAIRALVHDGNWFHIGTPEAIPLAEALL